MSSDFYLEISPNVGDMSRSGEHYLVNRRTEEWVKIDADAYEIIQRCEVMSYKEVIEMALKKYGGLKEDYIALFDILLEKSLLVHKDAIFRQLDERQEISPTLADVYVTKRCNLNCLTCFVDSLPPNDADILDADVIKQLLEKLAKGGCKEVHITGGEPLLRSDIFEILSHARNLFPRVTLSTNGTLINKKSALKLSGLIDSISIGLDGHIHRIYISYLHKNKIGDLMARLRGDCDSFAKFIKDTYIILTTSIPIILIGIFMVFRTDWQVGMFTVVYLFLYTIGFALFPERHQAIGKLYAEKSGELSSIMQEGLSGIYTVKTLCTEEEELKKLIDKSQEFIKTNVMLMWSLKKNGLAGMAINIFGTAFLNFYCAFQIINDRMTIGDLVAVMAWVGVVSGPIFDICQQYLNAQAVLGSIERIMTILNLPEQTYEGIIPPKIKGELVFDNVSFSYDGQNNKVIRNFSLKVSTGESLALVGESGAGKTTIVNLILRMEECQEGRILLDGYDISKINLHWLRKNISIVSQDTFLFNASIKDNISYGCSNISESRIYEVSKLSGVHDFVNEFPQGYETIIGERGVKLSGGQRQRIAIARALLRDPVILILDEAMSSVDSETEAVIQENLSKLMHGRTSIIISHRLATMRYANRIAVLGEGMILEIGTFPELVRRNGAFRKLFEKQLLMEPEYLEYI